MFLYFRKALSNLQTLSQLYATHLRLHNFTGSPGRLYEPMNYIMSLGGKRIRPLLTLIGARACGGNPEDALIPAHAMEVFHNFTLVHDDIMDNASSRRGQPTVHEKWSLAEGILSGDNMLIAVYQLLLDYKNPARDSILHLLTKTAREVCEGQQMDMDSAGLLHVSAEYYLEMIRLKTAVLLGCSLQCGAMTAGADEKVCGHLYDFAINLGLEFQLNDDWLDAFGNSEMTGKKPGGDIEEGKKTLLYIMASSHFDIDALWSKYSGTERVEKTLERFREFELDSKLKAVANEYHRHCLADLQKLNTLGVDTGLLVELSEWLQGRKH